MKLVITGQAANGDSIILEEREVRPKATAAFPQYLNFPFAGADAVATLPTDKLERATAEFFPPAGGYRFFSLVIEPDSDQSWLHNATPAELEQAEADFPGLFSIYDEEGMEQTNTIDFGYVISGSAALDLENGVTKILSAGDAFVQCGARHRWRNVGEERAVLVVVLLGTTRGG
jgi:hypothetical protein